MPESATTSPGEDLSHKAAGRKAAVLGALWPQPVSTDAGCLANLAHDEWSELCEDLERWLDEEPNPPR